MKAGGKTGRPKSATPKELFAFRFDAALIARIDAHMERLREQAPWAQPTRADAVRSLLVLGLDQAEGGERKAAPHRKRQP